MVSHPAYDGVCSRCYDEPVLSGVNGIWPLTHVGKYEGDVVAANISGDARPANYETVRRVTYTHAYAKSNGFLTLLFDGQRLTGACALRPKPASGCAQGGNRASVPHLPGQANLRVRVAKSRPVQEVRRRS